MNTISNRTLIARLFRSAEQQLEKTTHDTNSWIQWYQTVQEFTVPEKMVYIIVRLNQAVTNGGFAEFYENQLGIFAPEIIHIFNEIKATSSADIVASSLTVVNPNGLLDDDFKEFIFKIKLSSDQKSQLQAENMSYDHLQDIENLEDLLGDYLQELILG